MRECSQSIPDQRILRGSLGTTAIVFMVVAAAAPLTVFMATPITISQANGGGVPFNYLVAGLILLIFSVGFTAIARHVRTPGALYALIGAGLGKRAGVGAAFMALYSYITIQTAILAFFGASFSGLLVTFGAPATPWFLWTVIGVGIITWLGYRNIDIGAKVLAVSLTLEVVVIVILCVAVVAQEGIRQRGLSLMSFTPEFVFSGPLGIGIVSAIGGFSGFEATVVFRDETCDPVRSIPRATYTAVILIGAFYTVATWLLVEAWGAGQIKSMARTHMEDLVSLTATTYVGQWLAEAIAILLVNSLLACVILLHNVMARYCHSLAGDGLVARRLGDTHVRHGSPHVASLTFGVISLVLLGVWTWIGLNPVSEVFSWGTVTGSLGIIYLFTLTSIAVLAFFRRRRHLVGSWSGVIAPVVSIVALAAIAYFSASGLSTMSGRVNLAIELAIGAGPALAFVAGVLVLEAARKRSRNRAALLIAERSPGA